MGRFKATAKFLSWNNDHPTASGILCGATLVIIYIILARVMF